MFEGKEGEGDDVWTPPSLAEGLLMAAVGAEREGDGASKQVVVELLRCAPLQPGAALRPWPAG